jgi:type VI protein secretion system component Hcp
MTRQGDDKDIDAHAPMAELSECDLEKATGGSQSSGRGSGKVQHSDLQVQKYIDKASIILF